MINISKLAQKHFKKLLLKQNINTNIRLFIINIGTKKAKCGISYCSKEEVSINDIIVIYNFFKVYIDKYEIFYLKNTTIDVIINDLGFQLTVRSPLLNNKIISENSSLYDQLQNYLDININPKLLIHKGKVSLLEVTKYGEVMLQFSGGCNGCMMIEHTLKEMIEKKIMNKFSQVKKVYDVTKHVFGNHSYNFF